MPRTGRPKAELILTADEREQLTRDARRASSAQALALRSKIVLACADGLDNKTVAEQVRCSANTVSKWRRRFVEHRLDGLTDEPRPGRPRTISVDQVEDVIVATLESTPQNATHWTRSKMAARTGLSKTTIGKIWKDFGLKPHQVDHFKLSTDPLFIDKLYDVVGPLPEPARGRGGAVRGREVPGPGPAALPAGVPDDARDARATHPRLRPARHHHLVRGDERRRRHRDLQPAPTTPGDRVQEVPDQDRRRGPRRARDPPDLRQLRHPQAPRSSRPGSPTTHGCTCTSPRPTHPG